MTNAEKETRFFDLIVQLTRGLKPSQVDFNGRQSNGFLSWQAWFVGEDAELAALRLADHYDNVVVEHVRWEGSLEPRSWRVRTV